MKLETEPPISIVPVYTRRLKNGEKRVYYKAVRYRDGRSYYLCYIPLKDLPRLKSEPYKYFCARGMPVFPAQPKQKRKRECWSYCVVATKHVEGARDYRVGLRVYGFKVCKRVYIYFKRLWTKYDPFDMTSKEHDKGLKYVGSTGLNGWHNEDEIDKVLEKKNFHVTEHYEPRPKRRGRPRKPRQTYESELDWIMSELEQGEVENIIDRYPTVGTFLERHPDDEETARAIYGDREVDEFYEEE